jgi:AraC-like DNA-binding protein
METNFTKNLNLETLAKQTGRSLSAFKTDFKKEFNISPMKWLIDRRLTYANYLIRTTEDAISNIAYQSGFENISHFSRVYKKKYSISPIKSRG